MLSWGETCTVSLGQIWLMMMFILQGEQWKTPEFCFWRGKRKKIHGGKKSKTTYPRKYQWSLFQATENALKVQISQLETTLKSDLNDKSRLTEALAREREAFAQMESDFQVWRSPLTHDIHIIGVTSPLTWWSCSSFKFPGSTKQVPRDEGRCRKAGR